ncbi:MAG: hypothetical protein IKF82_00745 [Bacilli bacterium]|nr:hypothetical protein [Bacilli bacterium]
MKIFIDDREDTERIDLLKIDPFFANALITRLKTGDIVIEREDLTHIAIEVKTLQDWIQSCRSRQIQKEVLKMKEKYPFSYVIVYDDGKKNDFFIKPQSLEEYYSNLVSLTQRYKVPVFICKNHKHFVTCIKAIVNTVHKNDEPIEPPLVRSKASNEMINVLIGLPKCGPKAARKLLDYFHTPGGVFKASDEELDQVPRLTKVTKNAIRRMR